MNEDWFYVWREPTEFVRCLDTVSQGIKDRDHRTQANKWFREAWVLRIFAVAIKATTMRLVRDDPPDGEVKLGGRVVPIEVVEAFEEGRQPDREYKTGQVKDLSTIPEWDNELSLINDTIARAIFKKEARDYSKETILLIYLNIGNDPRTPPEGLRQFIRSKCDAGSSKFDAICILWRNWLFGPAYFIDGGQVEIDWRLLD